MHQNLLAPAAFAFAALILSACSSVTPAGLMAASRLDPLNTSPTEIVVAVGVPDSLRLADGDAQLYIGFKGGSAASTVLVEETAPLQVSRAPDGAIKPNGPDEAIYLARLAPEDAARIAAAQAEIKALRGRGIDGQGTLSIAVTGGCRVGAPLAALPVSTWLQTSPEDGFVRLTRQRDVFRAMDEGNRAALEAELTPCPS
ncbi:hypothetical protein [Roseobacter sinensis]|uniref:Lipoprotein n=1 Tax=Roseobacter sinensis TaxID=2931391 RepID=A0ABT3BH38_9RHOB|nr:hypothetical protein [Roseobacter sp. WL0113]MCV3272881.1 hypothetical protein [Roseobacter sp. WL0113]